MEVQVPDGGMWVVFCQDDPNLDTPECLNGVLMEKMPL